MDVDGEDSTRCAVDKPPEVVFLEADPSEEQVLTSRTSQRTLVPAMQPVSTRPVERKVEEEMMAPSLTVASTVHFEMES